MDVKYYAINQIMDIKKLMNEKWCPYDFARL